VVSPHFTNNTLQAVFQPRGGIRTMAWLQEFKDKLVAFHRGGRTCMEH
jgi:hypothetical protein